MRNSTLLFAIASAMLLQAVPAVAQNNVPIRKIKAVKPTTELTLLDKVESDSHKKEYQYNEYGYITSVMEYNKEAEQWVLNTDNSYRQEYVFNAAGQCTARTSFNVDKAGNKTTVKNEAKVEVIGNTTWERHYQKCADGKTHLSEAYAYDQWGNCVEKINYGYDVDSQTEFISSYEKRKYIGPVDKYADHTEFDYIKDYRSTYILKASPDDIYTMNVDDLNVDYFYEEVWQTENDKLYDRMYSVAGHAKVGQIETSKHKNTEIEYTLNNAGTRPIKKIEYFYNYPSTEKQLNETVTYEWDNRERLVSVSYFTGYSSELKREEKYTYADDYAKNLSLQEAIATIYGDYYFYMEDYYMPFGHCATTSFNDVFSRQKKEASYQWNADGQLTGGTWSFSSTAYDYNENKEYTNIDNYELRVGYNADGHMAWKIEHSITTGNFKKSVIVYNKHGIWTGGKTYGGESWDGPWTKDSDYGNVNPIAKKRLAMQAATTPKFIDDMSDGQHNIFNDDGVWKTIGDYTVTEGVVTSGSLRQTLASNASVPANPQYNYTDPLMPLEREEDEVYSLTSEAIWYYRWNTDKGDWEPLGENPIEAKRVYENDGNIVADIYDRNQTKVSSITYRLDDNNRLIEEVNSKGGNITYEYLPCTDYLLESVETAADGYRNVCHYYYSKHNYVDPTGIESIKRNDASTPVWYDLQGRRITTPTSKGIYIVNGKKVVVR